MTLEGTCLISGKLALRFFINQFLLFNTHLLFALLEPACQNNTQYKTKTE